MGTWRTMRSERVILVVTLAIGVSSRAVCAQPAINQELLQRIAALEAQLAELKRLVDAQQPVVEAGKAAERNAEDVQPEDRASLDYLHDLKYGVGLDTYYGFNFNRP